MHTGPTQLSIFEKFPPPQVFSDDPQINNQHAINSQDQTNDPQIINSFLNDQVLPLHSTIISTLDKIGNTANQNQSANLGAYGTPAVTSKTGVHTLPTKEPLLTDKVLKAELFSASSKVASVLPAESSNISNNVLMESFSESHEPEIENISPSETVTESAFSALPVSTPSTTERENTPLLIDILVEKIFPLQNKTVEDTSALDEIFITPIIDSITPPALTLLPPLPQNMPKENNSELHDDLDISQAQFFLKK